MMWKSMHTDLIVGGVTAVGLFLFSHHATYYETVWHWSWVDHGSWGFLLMAGGVIATIVRHPPKRVASALKRLGRGKE